MAKRNCYIVSYNGISNAGGVERVSYYLHRILEKKGFNVIIVNKELIESTKLGKLLILVFKKVPIIVFTILASFYIKIKKKENDISITQGFNAPFINADYLYLHGTMKGYVESVKQRKTFPLKVLFLLEKIAAIKAKTILSVSQNAINEVNKYYTSRKLNYVIVNNGVDSSVFLPKKYNSSLTNITVLYCGRLDEGKGLSKLLELSKAIEMKPNFNFVIACNNDTNTVLFSDFKKTKIFVGLTVNDMNKFYNSGDILFFPSMYEGFEMVSLEALSSGIPVLGNKIGAIGELEKTNSPGVYIIDQHKPSLQHIESIVRENYDKKDLLHHYYQSKFDIPVYGEKLNQIIK